MDRYSFTAFDVETANEKRNSLCQIGIIKVKKGTVIDKVEFLIQPPDNKYSNVCKSIHGITERDTENALTFNIIWKEIESYFINQRILAHSIDFDLDVLNQSLKYYGIPEVDYKEKICTYKLFNRKLIELCQAFDILIQHHNALSDAHACTQIYLSYLNGIEPNFNKVTFSKTQELFSQYEKLKGDVLKQNLNNADINNPFYNKKVVFTGTLSSISRQDAALRIKDMGADINTAISKLTDYVIIGKEAGPAKMSKIENLNSEGASIEILNEDEFLKMIL